MRRAITVFTLLCFVAVHLPGFGGPHDEGVEAGQAANAAARPKVNASDAAAHVPGYTSTPPQSSLYGRPNLTGAASAQVDACSGSPNNPGCEAITGAVQSANTSRPFLGPHDPAVAAARSVAANPAGVLGNLSAYYSGCTTTEVPGAARPTICHRYAGSGNFSCEKRLAVSVDLSTNCTPGDWFGHANVGSTGLDVQCIPNRRVSAQHFRVTEGGSPLAYFDVDMTASVSFPRAVATLATHVALDGTTIRTLLWIANNQCVGDRCALIGMVAAERSESCTGGSDAGFTCTYQVPFLPVYAECPSGTQSGEHIVNETCVADSGCKRETLDIAHCYVPANAGTGLPGIDATGTVPGSTWSLHSTRPVTGWMINPLFGPIPTMALAYERPTTVATERDQWDDGCPLLAAGGRCTQQTAPVCIEGASSRTINGVPVKRSCWAYQTTFACAGAPADGCAPLAAAGCVASSSICRQNDSATGACRVFEDTWSCPAAAATTTVAGNCPRDVFCLGTSCFNIASANDPDFARTVSMLEGAREAGVYLDTDRMRMFNGTPSTCSLTFGPSGTRVANCCKPNGSFGGYSNQSLFGGSVYMYDSLFSLDNARFLYQAVGAMLAGGQSAGSFSAYGVTVTVGAESVAALEASYAAGQSAGAVYVAESGAWAVSFDPWTLVIMIIVMLVIEELNCDAPEEIHNLRDGAGLCHPVGEYCASRHLFPHHRQCRKLNRAFCCFNSVLARLINEQGRAQFGKGWGAAGNPDCSGFTVAELQRLDFSTMDLTEFYASIAPKLPDVAATAGKAQTSAPACYYGQGRC